MKITFVNICFIIYVIHVYIGEQSFFFRVWPLDMDGSADGLPLLSQDEFFRHLNLQSVHACSAKYHYRQALKERLRASKVAVNGVNGVSIGKSGNRNNNAVTKAYENDQALLNGGSEREDNSLRFDNMILHYIKNLDI